MFITVVILVSRKASLGSALLFGAVVLGLWSHMAPLDVLACMVETLTSAKMLLLSGVVGLILVLSHLMEKTGQMKKLVSAFEGVSNNARVNLTVFPAIIGLLPMPGGAVFSAPMVDAMSKGYKLSPEDKVLINYWFRHIWEYCWPLYPGVVLACALGDISFFKYFLIMWPMTILAIFAGYGIILAPLKLKNSSSAKKESWAPLIRELTPVLIVVVGAGVLGVLAAIGNRIGLMPELPAEAPLIVALLAGVAWIVKTFRLDSEALGEIFKSKALWSMIYMIAGVMIFAGILQKSHLIEEISQTMAASNVPIALVAMLLPFMVGCMTGITVAFVGTTFPILYSLLDASGLGQEVVAYTILAFCSGYAGVMISPLHACLALTQTYFKASPARIYGRLSILTAIVLAGGFGAFFVIKYWL